MPQIISEEELNELKELTGEVRGAGIKTYAKFVLKEEGKEGLRKLEDVVTNFGYPGYDKLKSMTFYPLWFFGVNLLAIKRLFNYDDKKFQEIGSYNAKFTIIVRFLMKYLVSLDKAATAVQRMWRLYYTLGRIETAGYDKDKKYVTLRLHFRFHPLHCQVVKGYFSAITEMIVKSKVNCEEIKCLYQGDGYHEFLLKWE